MCMPLSPCLFSKGTTSIFSLFTGSSWFTVKSQTLKKGKQCNAYWSAQMQWTLASLNGLFSILVWESARMWTKVRYLISKSTFQNVDLMQHFPPSIPWSNSNNWPQRGTAGITLGAQTKVAFDVWSAPESTLQPCRDTCMAAEHF